MVNFCVVLKIIFFHIVVAIFDLIHDVEVYFTFLNCLYHLESFLNMSDARETALCSFSGITHIGHV